MLNVNSFATVILLATTALVRAQSPTTQASGDLNLHGPFNWVTTGPVMTAIADDRHTINAIKDPTVVQFGDKWHVFATSVTSKGSYSSMYLSFADWKDASKAKPFYFDQNPNLAGYHCAPQVFYFAPQKLWYLVMVSQHPMYSTTSDISKPETWSKPQNFFASQPKSVIDGWLDYWVICDDTHAYLFFTDDHGRFYRSRSTLQRFPEGFDDPVVAMQDNTPRELFEGSCTYKIKGTGQFLTLIEAGNEHWKRYYKAFIADRLDGEWRPLAATWGNSFADASRIRMQDGTTLWTSDISHGELLRDGYDQTLTINAKHLTFLYQAIRIGETEGKGYNELPWQLGLLRRE